MLRVIPARSSSSRNQRSGVVRTSKSTELKAHKWGEITGKQKAEKIVQQGLESFGLSESDLKPLPGSDPRKVAIAGFISPKHDNPARLDGGAPADEKRSQYQSAT
jgi:hypothetical protein